MVIKTKAFGEIDLDENKVIEFDNGIMGFENYKKYTILFDVEEGESHTISWLQNIEEPSLALPVITPLLIKEDYNPVVEDELLKPLGDLTDENTLILLAVTVPADIKKMTVNLKAPFIVNSDTKKGCQAVAENSDYLVRYPIYDELKGKQHKEEK